MENVKKMTPEQHHMAADNLDIAEKTLKQIGCITQDHTQMSMADAYAIQAAWVSKKLEAGRRIIGRKIGLTSRAMQMQLGIDIPDSGILLDDMVFENGVEIPARRFIEPRVEAEIAFIMADDLQGPDVTPADVLAATEYVAPALEILDTRIFRVDPKTGKKRNVLDTISDNAANAGIVLGDQRWPAADIDLKWVGAILSRNGVIEETGLGAGVLGDPLASMAWLANRLAEHGDFIRKGEIVLSGSFIRAVEAPPKSEFQVDFGAFGSISCSFA